MLNPICCGSYPGRDVIGCDPPLPLALLTQRLIRHSGQGLGKRSLSYDSSGPPRSKLPIEPRHAVSSQYSLTMKRILATSLLFPFRSTDYNSRVRTPTIIQILFSINTLEIGCGTGAQMNAFGKGKKRREKTRERKITTGAGRGTPSQSQYLKVEHAHTSIWIFQASSQ